MPDDSGNKLKETKKLDSLFSRIFGSKSHQEKQQEAEEEILSLVEEGQEKGVIGDSTKNIIENVFDFDDTTASEIMTHRTEVTAIERNASLPEIVATAIDSGFSRIPVYKGDIDSIVGVLYVKDLLPFVGKTIPSGKKLSKLMREAEFVPESKRCGDLFTEMTEKRVQMMFVSDEYGAVSGLVTIEDLLESIVGNIQDEYDDEEEDIVQLDEKTFNFDGTTDIEEVEETLDIEIPEGEFDTLGGLIMSELDRMPEEKDEIVYLGYKFIVEEMDERRIDRVRIEKLPEEERISEGEED